MRISEQGIALIKRFEGFSSIAYRCPAGLPTIGYGHVMRPGECFQEPIDEQYAHGLLMKDVKWAEQAVGAVTRIPLMQYQFDALVCLAYNIVAEALARSTLIKLLNNNDISGAKAQFYRWDKVKGTRIHGLTLRREREAKVFAGEINN